MKKLKDEAELIEAAILAGMKVGEDRGAVVFEPAECPVFAVVHQYWTFMKNGQ